MVDVVNGQNWKHLAGAFRTVLNLFIAAVLTLMFTQWREFQKEVRTNIDELENANALQDQLSSQLRLVGFERLSKVETLLEEHQKRMDRMDRMGRASKTQDDGG